MRLARGDNRSPSGRLTHDLTAAERCIKDAPLSNLMLQSLGQAQN
jgi:hypothetical protein